MSKHPSLETILKVPLTEGTAKPVIDIVVGLLRLDPPQPRPQGEGTGYVMSAGGRYARHGYATCRFIREILQDDAPIEVWVGKNETLENWDIPFVLHRQSPDTDGGWPLKARAVKHSHFRHVVFLDSDCLPMQKAKDLTASPEYQKTGAVFFPDIADCRKSNWAFPVLGLKLNSVPEMEAGQFLIDRVRHSLAIELVDYFNQRSEFFYKHTFGDKDLWSLAFARLGIPFTTAPACENKDWGLRHFMPDGAHGFDHLIHTKFAGKEYDGEHAQAIASYLEDYEDLTRARLRGLNIT